MVRVRVRVSVRIREEERIRMRDYAQRDGRPLLKMTRSESPIIPFRVPGGKVWMMPTARVPCSIGGFNQRPG